MKENKNLKTITQIGVVVPSLEAAMEGMKKVFGVEPARFGRTPDKNKFYHGQPGAFAAKMAFYDFANIEIELVEPQEGDSIWKEFLDSGKCGLHHLRFSIDSMEETVEDMRERGAEVVMEGESVRQIPGLRWAYFGTEKELDWTIEVLNEYEVGQKSEKPISPSTPIN